MTTRAGLPFRILEKTFFTRSREEYFRVIEARNQRSALKGFTFMFSLKNGAAEPCELITTNSMARVVVFTGRGQVVVRFRKPNHDAIGDQHKSNVIIISIGRDSKT